MVTEYTEEMMSSAVRTVKYPSPFFDIVSTYLPKNIKTLFKFCRDYFKTNGWLRNVITKLATYPITDLLFDSSIDQKTKKELSEVLNNKLRIKSFLIEVGLDYYTYGNVFISTFLKTKRFLKCSACGEQNQYESVKKLKLRNYEFHGNCPVCGKDNVFFTAIDEPIKSINNFRLVRWSPDNIDIDFNPITGSATYYYSIPNKIKAQIIAGNTVILKDTPLVFLEALKKNQKIELEPDNLYHIKYPSLAEEDMGFGIPMILPALKEIYYLQILRKGNEAIANDHMVPKKTISPANTATMDPFTQMNLGKWRGEVEQTIKKWKLDPNHIAIFPIPMQYQELGGNAKMLMVTPEMKFTEESIINSLGVPLEFIKGGASWTGSSVSLRIIENGFINYREFLGDFLNYFLLPKLTGLLGYPEVKVSFKKFKMADDSEAKQLAIQLNATGKISDPKLLDEFGYDSEEENETLRKSRLSSLEDMVKDSEKQAEGQGKAQVILAVYQARAQKAMTDEQFRAKAELFENEIAQENGSIPEDPYRLIDKYAIELLNLPVEFQQQKLMELQKKMPITFTMVMERMTMYQAQMMQMMPELAQPQGQGKPKNGKAPNHKGPGKREGDKVKQTKDDSKKKHGPTKGSV